MSPFDPPSEAFLAQRGRVTTLGMFIIDHFEVKDEAGNPVPTDEEAIGGGGIYAMTSARMFLPPSHVGFLADKGDDFPPQFETVLRGFGDDMVWFRPREGKTTRALNVYSGRVIGEGHQTFKYLSPQLQIVPGDYLSPSSPFSSPPPEWMHVVCDTTRGAAVLKDVQLFRSSGWKGLLAWEPLIRRIEPGSLPTYLDMSRHFAVFSPNHLELQTILEEPDADVETCARHFRQHLLAAPGPVPAIVVRAGAEGAFTLSDGWTGWVPAFWRRSEGDHVVDPTGGGNSFLGGLCAGLLVTNNDYRAASIYASTCASFTIEQRGLPVLTTGPDGERWNGVSPWDRLREMARRVDEMERRPR